MADSDLYTTIKNPQIPPNPTKFYTHFLYKAIFASIFLLILPLLQAPDFINQTINTRSWELLQLLFVGIAVSYGLFSKRNEEAEKESVKSDSPQSYVPGFLQVSSVFDDDSENPSGSEDNSKVQTWNSQYYRGEPIVVVAKESSVLDEHGDNGGSGSRTVEKPLLLPVRSLKKGAPEASMAVSGSNSRRFSRNLSKLSAVSPEESPEENIVFRSPIPWRSRSGRMEVKEDAEPPSMAYLRSQSLKSSKSISNSSSASNLPSETPPEDFSLHRKKSSFSPTPPPPPPPPPPHSPVTFSGRGLRRTTRSFPEKATNDLQNRERTRTRTGAEFMIRSRSDISPAAKSFRPTKETEFEEYLTDDKEIESFIEKRGSQSKKSMNEHTQTFTEYPKTEHKEFITSIAMDSGQDSGESEEEEDDDELEKLASKKGEEMGGKDCSDNGPDVDKKADEFIAKFREQIRLQRIASIRRSTGQAPRNGVR